MRYVDYDAALVVPATALDYLTLKRDSFQHERELRAVILASRPLVHGQNVACDLDRLIERVYVSPATASWVRAAVKAVARRYGLEREVHQSNLDREPFV